MKKNLIALAVFGAFSGAALAQSNVTLYGVVDVGYQYIDTESGPNTSGIAAGQQSGSRFGLRGTEALSPNLNAVFTLEAGFNTDTGTSGQNGQLFGRQAWGGLQGPFGTLVAGRIPSFSSGTGSFDMTGGVDPFGTGFNDAGLQSSVTPQGSLRLDNTLLYETPVFAGFKFGAGYSWNGFGGESAGSGNNNKVAFAGARWGAGPFYGVITYDVIEPRATAGSATAPRVAAGSSDQKHLLIGATFDLKFMKIHGAFAKEDNVWFGANLGSATVVQPDAGADADAWMLGLTFRLFGGELFGSYQTRDGDAVNVCLSASLAVTCPVPLVSRERDIDTYAIGFTYPFSRRTNFYIVASDKDGEKSVQNDPNIDRKMYQIGLRHLF